MSKELEALDKAIKKAQKLAKKVKVILKEEKE